MRTRPDDWSDTAAIRERGRRSGGKVHLMATLKFSRDGRPILFRLSTDETVLGRQADCEVRLIDDAVSRRHARIVRDRGDFYVEDLASGNGTFLNGKRIAQQTRLVDGDQIRLGLLTVEFSDEPLEVGNPSLEETTTIPLSAFPIRAELSNSADSSLVNEYLEQSAIAHHASAQPEARLQAVLDIARSVAQATDFERQCPGLLTSILAIFPQAQRAAILLRGSQGEELQPVAAVQAVRSEQSVTAVEQPIRISRTVLHHICKSRAGVVSTNLPEDVRFVDSKSLAVLDVRSVICVPLLAVNRDVIGAIYLDTTAAFRFRREDLELLSAVAGQMELSYQRDRLLVVNAEKERQDSEMQIARQVQRATLPKAFPAVGDYSFFAVFEPALAVSGDYYDCISGRDGKVWVALGDVSGKGVPAALVASRLMSLVENAVELTDDVSEAVFRINRQLCAHSHDGRFATFVLCQIDSTSNRLCLANAGHAAPLLVNSAGDVRELADERSGLPLGIDDSQKYPVIVHDMQPGEACLLFSDGVTEARNPAGDYFGSKRLKRAMTDGGNVPCELADRILNDLRLHLRGALPEDDLTLVIFGRKQT